MITHLEEIQPLTKDITGHTFSFSLPLPLNLMEIQIRYIPETADKWEVIRAISSVVHHHSFIEAMRNEGIKLVDGNMPLECMNFDVDLDMCENRGLRNMTTGTLLLCNWTIGDMFLARVTTDLPARVQGKKLRFYRRNWEMTKKMAKKVEVLGKTRFIDPEMQEKRETTKFRLRDGFTTVRALHLGFILKEGQTKIFSSEFKVQKYGQLWIDYDQKLFRILVRVPPPSSLVSRVLRSPLSWESLRWMKSSGVLSSPSTTSEGSGWAMTMGVHVCMYCHLYELALDLELQMWRSVYMRLPSSRTNSTTVTPT